MRFLVDSFAVGCLARVGQAVIVSWLLERQAIKKDLVEEWVVAVAVDGKWTEKARRMGMRWRSGRVDLLGHG